MSGKSVIRSVVICTCPITVASSTESTALQAMYSMPVVREHRLLRANRSFVATLAIVALVSVAGCSMDGTPKSPLLSGGSMSATVDGKAWTATLSVTSAANGGVFAAAGSGDGITIGFGGLAQVGEQKIEDGLGANGNYVEGYTTPVTWVSSPGTGTGTINVLSLTDTGASGTFSFVATPAPSSTATGTRTITNGTFDVKFIQAATGKH